MVQAAFQKLRFGYAGISFLPHKNCFFKNPAFRQTEPLLLFNSVKSHSPQIRRRGSMGAYSRLAAGVAMPPNTIWLRSRQ